MNKNTKGDIHSIIIFLKHNLHQLPQDVSTIGNCFLFNVILLLNSFICNITINESLKLVTFFCLTV